MAHPYISDARVLAVLHRALAEVSADPRPAVAARPPLLAASHIAYALKHPDCPILEIPAAPRVSDTVAARITHCLIRLRRDRLVQLDRAIVGRVFVNQWAITLDGVARAQREAA